MAELDILGAVETTAHTPFREVGGVKVIQIEDLIPERILIGTVPARNEALLNTARILLAVAISGMVKTDFEELNRVASSPDYRVNEELQALMEEVKLKLQHQP